MLAPARVAFKCGRCSEPVLDRERRPTYKLAQGESLALAALANPLASTRIAEARRRRGQPEVRFVRFAGSPPSLYPTIEAERCMNRLVKLMISFGAR